MKIVIIIFALVFAHIDLSFAQTVQYQIMLEPVNINGLKGVQSYAYGQHDGKWLIVSSRY